MPSTSETSFGAKLRKGQDILTYISGFTGYNPPRTQESVPGFGSLITTIISTNATESSQQENYKVAVDLRQAAFLRKIGSVDKLLSPIKGAVESQFGKKSTEAVTINAIIRKMRATKLIKLPPDPTNPEQQSTLSQSERSYGSMTQFFNDIINTLTQFTGYNPSNTTIKIVTLQTTTTTLTTLNNSVIQKIQLLKTTRVNRLALYVDLKDRVQRIKSYVKAQYGNSSNEYNLIKGISI
ncbi:MAG: hypothetical protein V1904_05540 [Bacteroidota bacterium]